MAKRHVNRHEDALLIDRRKTRLEDADLKAGHVCHNWHALLEKNPTWQALIGDAMSEEVEEHHSADEENAADQKNNSLLQLLL